MDHQDGVNDLTPTEAGFLLTLLRQVKAGVNFDPGNPDEAIEAARLYKAIIGKLKAKAQEPE